MYVITKSQHTGMEQEGIHHDTNTGSACGPKRCRELYQADGGVQAADAEGGVRFFPERRGRGGCDTADSAGRL